MHEAGLARALVSSLRERGLRLNQVRLDIRGGHHEPDQFEAAFRAHLADALPDQAAAARGVEIQRVPSGRFCLTCGREFDAPGIDEPCPTCGSETLPAVLEEEIEIQLLAGAA